VYAEVSIVATAFLYTKKMVPCVYAKQQMQAHRLNRVSSVAEPEPHLLVGAGSGAVTRCGSDGSGSNNGIQHG
jgi:hypothetical protein